MALLIGNQAKYIIEHSPRVTKRKGYYFPLRISMTQISYSLKNSFFLSVPVY